MAKSIEDAVAGLKEKDNGKDNNKDNNTPVNPETKTYTVTFKAAGGSAVKAQKVEEGKSVSKPKNQRERVISLQVGMQERLHISLILRLKPI